MHTKSILIIPFIARPGNTEKGFFALKLLAIDGNSILNRAFFGVRLLSNKKGIYTNAIFGFLNILLKLTRDYAPDATAIAFDVSRHTFRNDQYDGYKANRKGMPEELAVQLPLIKEILTDMGYTLATCEGYEGDDVLGALAARCCVEGNECIVATGDRDCLQLVTSCVSVSMQKTKETILYTPERVREEYGFEPVRIVDMKALMGDASDNIPGVKGIGEKTALTLIQKNGSLDEIYDKLDGGSLETTDRIKKLLREGREMAYLSRQLATIVTDAPIQTDAADYVRRPADLSALAGILTDLELYSFMDKFGVDSTLAASDSEAENIPCSVITENAADEAIKAMASAKEAAVLLVDDGLQINIGGTSYLVPPEDLERVVKAVFARPIRVNTFLAKPLYKLAWELGCSDADIAFDAELAAYLLSPSSRGYSLEGLREHYLSGFRFDAGEDDTLLNIASLPKLCGVLESELETEGLTGVFTEIEMPLCEVLANMEVEGFAIDEKGVEQFGAQLDHDIQLTQEEIIRLAGEDFNINSTRELGRILFEKLGLPAKKKTKTGYSTNIDVLESIVDQHPIVPQIIEYRKLTKLYSTYVVGLLKVVGEDGRVRSTFNQTETRTGRISSTEPNVQNIPVRTPLGSEMRRFFVARQGYTLVDADYSQIELRILAHIADDQNMIRAFRENADIHAITASQVFGYPLETLPHELRSRAKAINFGIVYGIGAYSLSQQINVSMAEAKEYIEAYLRTYSGVASYQRTVVEQARKDGYVSTIYGRRRDLADINSTNKTVRAFAERVALNMPVQGTAADIIKLAMNRVYHRLRAEGLDAKLILQVHDELIIEANDLQVGTVTRLLREEMEHAADLSVPLLVDVSTGKNWYEAKQ